MVDERRLVQSCVSHINNAKSDIESFTRSARDQKIRMNWVWPTTP